MTDEFIIEECYFGVLITSKDGEHFIETAPYKDGGGYDNRIIALGKLLDDMIVNAMNQYHTITAKVKVEITKVE